MVIFLLLLLFFVKLYKKGILGSINSQVQITQHVATKMTFVKQKTELIKLLDIILKSTTAGSGFRSSHSQTTFNSDFNMWKDIKEKAFFNMSDIV